MYPCAKCGTKTGDPWTTHEPGIEAHNKHLETLKAAEDSKKPTQVEAMTAEQIAEIVKRTVTATVQEELPRVIENYHAEDEGADTQHERAPWHRPVKG
jgi:hypothetical protein